MAGFEEMREALSAMPIAKLYEISEGDVPTVCALTAPQKAADVEASIRAAEFTSGADKELVPRMYREFRQRIFEAIDVEGQYALYDDHVANMRVERQRFGGHGGGGRALVRQKTLTSIEREEATRKRERAQQLVRLLESLLHTVPIGLVQCVDYVSDLLVLYLFSQWLPLAGTAR